MELSQVVVHAKYVCHLNMDFVRKDLEDSYFTSNEMKKKTEREKFY